MSPWSGWGPQNLKVDEAPRQIYFLQEMMVFSLWLSHASVMERSHADVSHRDPNVYQKGH